MKILFGREVLLKLVKRLKLMFGLFDAGDKFFRLRITKLERTTENYPLQVDDSNNFPPYEPQFEGYLDCVFCGGFGYTYEENLPYGASMKPCFCNINL